MPDYSQLGIQQNPQFQNPFSQIQPLQYQPINLDDIMNNAINMKTALMQQQAMQSQLTQQKAEQALNYGAFGVDPSQVNPQSVQAAYQSLQNPQMQPQPGQGQGMFQNPGQPMQQSPQQQGLMNLLRMRQAQAGLGFQGQQAVVGGQVADTAQKQWELQQMQGTPGQESLPVRIGEAFGNGPNPSPNPLPISDVSSILSRQEPWLKTAATSALFPSGQAPNYRQNQINFEGEVKGAETQNSPQVQVPLKLANSAVPIINELDSLINKTAGNSWQAINKFGLALAQQKGDKPAQALRTQVSLVAKDVNTILGGNTDVQFDNIMKAIDTSQSKGQLLNSSAQLRNYVYSKITAFGGKLPTIKRTLRNGQSVNVVPMGNGQFAPAS